MSMEINSPLLSHLSHASQTASFFVLKISLISEYLSPIFTAIIFCMMWNSKQTINSVCLTKNVHNVCCFVSLHYSLMTIYNITLEIPESEQNKWLFFELKQDTWFPTDAMANTVSDPAQTALQLPSGSPSPAQHWDKCDSTHLHMEMLKRVPDWAAHSAAHGHPITCPTLE